MPVTELLEKWAKSISTCIDTVVAVACAIALAGQMPIPVATGIAHADEEGLRVLDGTWTNAVRQRSHGQRYDGVAPKGPLYFWTRIGGTAGDIETLRREQRLPIYHKWFHAAAGEIHADDAEAFHAPALEVPLDVGNANTVDPLEREVADRGYFDWRTWSVKVHVSPGRWIVRVVDAQNDVLRCGGHDCEYRILVR